MKNRTMPNCVLMSDMSEAPLSVHMKCSMGTALPHSIGSAKRVPTLELDNWVVFGLYQQARAEQHAKWNHPGAKEQLKRGTGVIPAASMVSHHQVSFSASALGRAHPDWILPSASLTLATFLMELEERAG